MIVHKHLAPKIKESLLSHLYRQFRFPRVIPVECIGGQIKNFGVSAREGFTVAYRQLFIFAWRYFPELSSLAPKKDKKKPKPQAKAYNDILSFKFLMFAHDLGFNLSMPRTNPETRMIQKFLHEIRPPEMFSITSSHQSALIRDLFELISTRYSNSGRHTSRGNHEQSTPDLNRCGRPSDTSHQSSKTDFFYGSIYCSGAISNPYLNVNLNIFKLFFGIDSYESNLQEMIEEEQHSQRLEDAPPLEETPPIIPDGAPSSIREARLAPDDTPSSVHETRIAPDSAPSGLHETQTVPDVATNAADHNPVEPSPAPPAPEHTDPAPPSDEDMESDHPEERTEKRVPLKGRGPRPRRVKVIDYDKKKRVFWRPEDVGPRLQNLNLHQFAIAQKFRDASGSKEQLQSIDRERVEKVIDTGTTWVLFSTKQSAREMMRDGERVLREIVDRRDLKRLQ